MVESCVVKSEASCLINLAMASNVISVKGEWYVIEAEWEEERKESAKLPLKRGKSRKGRVSVSMMSVDVTA